MSLVLLNVRDGLAEVVLNRPKVNAFNKALIEEVGDAFRRIEGDPEIRGALIKAEGRTFSAGLDLREVAALDRAGAADFFDAFDRNMRPAFTCLKPVACAVRGHAIAGGLVLALCADFLALGHGEYRIGLTELAVGVPFPREAFEIVNAGLSHRAAKRLIYGADTIPPKEAFELGVGDVLVEDPERAARDWLETTCSRPLAPFQIAKRQFRADAWAKVQSAPAKEREELLDIVFSPEIRAVLEWALGQK